MADKKKDAKHVSPKDAKKGVPAVELRDLDLLDTKIEKVKGGLKRARGRKRG